MKYSALGSKLIIKPIQDVGISPGGIIIPEPARRREDQGVVISKGRDVSNELDIGDHVFFNPYAGEQIADEDLGLIFIIKEDQISLIKTGEDREELFAKSTVIRLIQEVFLDERIGFTVEEVNARLLLDDVEQKVVNRINGLTQSEGFQW